MNKLKVILVDDEILIRKKVRMKIEAEELGIEIVGEYSDAVSALEELKELQPDIVISDICMPKMDGIYFSEQCVKIFPGIKVILITEYDDFEHARRSIKAGVHDFLMKPIQGEELNTAIKKAAETIHREHEQIIQKNRLLEEREKNQVLLREMYFKNLLINDIETKYIEENLRNYGVNIAQSEKEGIYVGILAIYESVSDPEILGRVKNDVKNFFQGEKSVYTVIDFWGRLCVIYCGDVLPFEDYFGLLIQYIVQKRNYKVEYGVSDRIKKWQHLPLGYKEAIQDMQYKHDEKKLSRKKLKNILRNAEGMDSVLEYINEGSAEDALRAWDEVYQHQKGTDTVYIDEIYHQMNYLLAFSGDKEDKLREWIMRRVALSRCSKDLKRCMDYLVIEMIMTKDSVYESEKGRMIRSMIQYLRKNFNNAGLSVNVLTEEFSVSRSYLNRLFKGYVGKTYSEFLSDLRYWKMLEYLSGEPDMRDREIGEKIGIADAHYLSIWFRKMTGYSVTEYRKLKIINK